MPWCCWRRWAADEAAGCQRALPGYAYSFPRDHGSRPAFRTEWWSFTGNLDAAGGRAFGFELTIFRVRTSSAATSSAPVVTPRFEDQELQTERLTGTVYCEGAVTIEGTWEGRPAAGRGCVELTGYAEPMSL